MQNSNNIANNIAIMTFQYTQISDSDKAQITFYSAFTSLLLSCNKKSQMCNVNAYF